MIIAWKNARHQYFNKRPFLVIFIEGSVDTAAMPDIGLTPLDWLEVMLKPEEADNSGSYVIAPNGVPNDSEHRWVWITGKVRYIVLRLRYNRSISGTIISPVIQVYGKTPGGKDFPLSDAAGQYEIELTINKGSDVDDGATYQWTKAKRVYPKSDLGISERLIPVIEVAFSATGPLTDSVIEAQLVP